MEKSRLFNVKNIVGTAILVAVEVILQLIGMIIPTPVTVNLSLVPITIGAILFGPISGGFLGIISGLIILLTPNTVTLFMAISPVGTVITCLTKTMFAGVIAGLAYVPFKNKNMKMIGVIIASILVPLINTFVFSIWCLIFFIDGLNQMGFDLHSYWAIFTGFIGFNFILEIIANTIVTPSIYKAIDASSNKYNREAIKE